MRVQALGHVVLKVRNLERALRFYQDVLGMRLVARKSIGATPMAFFSIAGNHHDLALMEMGDQAGAPPGNATGEGGPDALAGGRGPESCTGLAHLALKIGNSVDELRAARDHLRTKSVSIDRTVQHNVAQSLYVRDPDGNVVELYVDADPSTWRNDPSAVAHSEPLAL